MNISFIKNFSLSTDEMTLLMEVSPITELSKSLDTERDYPILNTKNLQKIADFFNEKINQEEFKRELLKYLGLDRDNFCKLLSLYINDYKTSNGRVNSIDINFILKVNCEKTIEFIEKSQKEMLRIIKHPDFPLESKWCGEAIESVKIISLTIYKDDIQLKLEKSFILENFKAEYLSVFQKERLIYEVESYEKREEAKISFVKLFTSKNEK